MDLGRGPTLSSGSRLFVRFPRSASEDLLGAIKWSQRKRETDAVQSMQGGVKARFSGGTGGTRGTRNPAGSAWSAKPSRKAALGLELEGWGFSRQLRRGHRGVK